jgi:quinoprotein glucose dehydrogenase
MHPFKTQAIIFFAFVFILSCSQSSSNTVSKYEDWKVYGGSNEAIRYSSLTQIDTNNITQLQVAWEYHTGDADTALHSQIQCNPIIVDGVLFGTSPQLKLVALDAATGKEKWVFDPNDTTQKKEDYHFILHNNRGVSYWADKEDKRIYYAAGSDIYCVNAATGKVVDSFGKRGKVDLRDGLGKNVSELFVTNTSPLTVYKDLLISGSRVHEGPGPSAPGHIRAYDIRTGKQRWIFHTIPQPGEAGFESWEDSLAYRHIGGGNVWSGFSLDAEKGILFAPTGSAAYDFYGGARKGNNLYTDCLLALDANTGKRIWHFQNIHHDVWDRDLPTPPALVTVTLNGKKIEVVAQPTKTGFVLLFERASGKPVYPIEEKAVPTGSPLAGEKLSPTQPFPSLPVAFVRQSLSENDINPYLPGVEQDSLRTILRKSRNGLMFNPPSQQGTIIFPGYDGGAEWGGPAFDPGTGLLYVNANEMAWILKMVEAAKLPKEKETYAEAGKRLYLQQCMSCHGGDLKGTGNNPTLIDIDKKYTETGFNELLVSGRRMMPSFKQLSTQERDAISSFVMGLTAKEKKTYKGKPRATNIYDDPPYRSTGYNKFLSKEGYPAIAPPWGTLSAINLSTGQISWQIPFGEFPALTAKGIPTTGTENYGGPVVTAGGLLFIAATSDGKFHVYNKNTGKLLWQYQLPAAGFATPATYSINNKQYIVIACGGGKLGTKSGDSYVAFALTQHLAK